MNSFDSFDPHITIRPNVGLSASIRQTQAFEFKRLFVEQPILIVVQDGTKTLRCQNAQHTIHAGSGIAIAGGQHIDVCDQISAKGVYSAQWLTWDTSLISAYAEQHPTQPIIYSSQSIPQMDTEFSYAFGQATQALSNTDLPECIARHRVSEILIWLGIHIGRFAPLHTLSWEQKVRHIIARNVTEDWHMHMIAQHLAVSESTLRRRLREEGKQFHSLLTDVRMLIALRMLQSTQQSMTQIALYVGYQTSSHFSASFKKRFGIAPSSLRRPKI